MRIEVTRSGGFAGSVRRAVVDTDGLADAEEWHRLAEEALAGGAGPSQAASPVRDGFRYEFTVDGSRGVEAGEQDLTPAQRTLASRALAEGARA
ncbi:protealysin inhibitor emfourin [Streptomyces fragilis]|uniref:Protealysin inhibitor emfourin n=1 Tax=Streptomyces fragilis TaxID=67301 RepID=A0ABV2YJ03_9ACTN|nr:protealysin inhibitor emfourin [Streptomyces fragilis]